MRAWRLRAPAASPFIDDACARGVRAGASGDRAVSMALACALHGIGPASDWARNTPLPGCGSASFDAARLLARSGSASLVDGAVGCVRAGDTGGARCLLRAAAWVVGIKGATEVEPAMLEALHGEVEAEPGAPFSEVRSRFILLLGPDPSVAVGLLQLLEALARRRPSNSPRLFLDTLQTSWGFRHSPRVRRALARLIAWLYRCPVAKGRFSHFPADNMKPIQQRVQRCAWLVQGEWTVPSASHADYERETGLTIGDGPVEDA